MNDRKLPDPRINTTGRASLIERILTGILYAVLWASLAALAVAMFNVITAATVDNPCYFVEGEVLSFNQAAFRNSYVTVERDGNTLIIPLSELKKAECE